MVMTMRCIDCRHFTLIIPPPLLSSKIFLLLLMIEIHKGTYKHMVGAGRYNLDKWVVSEEQSY